MAVSFFEQYRKQCEECNNGNEVFIPANDPKNGQRGDKIDILFVNERPGPKATKQISFENPDGSAKRFKFLFGKTFGLDYRKKIFITNAVLWCPQVEKPKNINPKRKDIKDGLENLSDQIKQLKPRVIVAMGRSALYALNLCFNNDTLNRKEKLKFRDIVGDTITVESYKIVPLFHTSSRNIRNRSELEQLKDWKKMKTKI